MRSSFRVIPVLATFITLLPVAAAAQVQQVATGRFSLAMGNAAAAAEFNAAIDDWYLLSRPSAIQRMNKARQMDPSMALARVVTAYFAGAFASQAARDEMTSAAAEAA